MKIVEKIRRAKKAVLGTLAAGATMVALVAPDLNDEYAAGVGIIGAFFTGLVIYFSTNES